jgi:Tetratricopeptide repeat
MKDPERLLSATSKVTALERELLTRLRAAKAPAHAREAAWNGVAAALAATALTSAAAASPTAAGANAALSLTAKLAASAGAKLALLAVLSAAAVGGGAYWLQRQRTPQPTRRAPVAAQVDTPAAAPPAVIQAAAPAEPPATLEPPSHAPNKNKEPAPLTEESALLTRARSELRAGARASAQRSLDRLRARFPNGVLAQERDVLSIELLSARGDHASARRAARAFVTRYPDSPHSVQLRTLLASP